MYLFIWYTSGQQFNHVPSLHDDVGIIRFASGSHRHTALNQVQVTRNTLREKEREKEGGGWGGREEKEGGGWVRREEKVCGKTK